MHVVVGMWEWLQGGYLLLVVFLVVGCLVVGLLGVGCCVVCRVLLEVILASLFVVGFVGFLLGTEDILDTYLNCFSSSFAWFCF